MTLQPGATLQIGFTVRNGATTACTYTAPSVGVAPGPTPPTSLAGPCGSVFFGMVGPNHRTTCGRVPRS